MTFHILQTVSFAMLEIVRVYTGDCESVHNSKSRGTQVSPASGYMVNLHGATRSIPYVTNHLNFCFKVSPQDVLVVLYMDESFRY